MTYARRTDANQPDIVAQLRRVPGMTVQAVSDCAGLGFDIIVRYQNGPPLLMEIKVNRSAKLTVSEQMARKTYGPFWARVHDINDALTALGISTDPAPENW